MVENDSRPEKSPSAKGAGPEEKSALTAFQDAAVNSLTKPFMVTSRTFGDTKHSNTEDKGAFSAFKDAAVDAVARPFRGTAQAFGKEVSTARPFDENHKAASYIGAMAGDASTFIVSTLLLKNFKVIGKAAPIVTGGLLGAAEPLKTDQGIAQRVTNGAVGLLTVGAMEGGGAWLKDAGMKGTFQKDVSRSALSGFGAGVVHTEATSLLNTGKLADTNTAVTDGLIWAATGAGLHTAGFGAGKLKDYGAAKLNWIGKPMPGEVFVVGDRYSPACFEARDFLSKNHVPFKSFDSDRNWFARRLVNASEAKEPIIMTSDGKKHSCTDSTALADFLGIRTKPMYAQYDVVSIGGGPSGTQTGIYSASEGHVTGVFEKRGPGGQAATTSRVENLMGYPNGVSGQELTSNAVSQFKRLGGDFVLTEVQGLERQADGMIRLSLKSGETVDARAVVLATGQQFKPIAGIPNLERLHNRGVYYGGAVTEVPMCKSGEQIVIAGGGNSAGQAAVKYSELVGDTGAVTINAKHPLENTMSQYLIDQIKQRPNIKVNEGVMTQAVDGATKLESVTYAEVGPGNVIGAKTTIPADNMFVFIGQQPGTSWLPEAIARDGHGFVLAGEAVKGTNAWKLERAPFANETSVPGVFTAGDVHSGTPKRIATAVGEGGMAAEQIWDYMKLPEAAKPIQQKAPIATEKALPASADMKRVWTPRPEQPSSNLPEGGVLWGLRGTTPLGGPAPIPFNLPFAPAVINPGDSDERK